MTLNELFSLLNARALRLHREGQQIVVVGDAARVTPELKAALTERKSDLLALLPEPKPRPPWWSDGLSDAENEAVDEFMGYGPAGPAGEDEAHEVALADVAPCIKCGSLWAWWDFWGGQHCRTCDPPVQSVRLAKRAKQVRDRYAPPNARGTERQGVAAPGVGAATGGRVGEAEPAGSVRP